MLCLLHERIGLAVSVKTKAQLTVGGILNMWAMAQDKEMYFS